MTQVSAKKVDEKASKGKPKSSSAKGKKNKPGSDDENDEDYKGSGGEEDEEDAAEAGPSSLKASLWDRRCGSLFEYIANIKYLQVLIVIPQSPFNCHFHHLHQG